MPLPSARSEIARYRADFVRRFNRAASQIDGWHLSSYIRSAAQQAELRKTNPQAARYSQHVVGLAADIAPDRNPTGPVTSRSRVKAILRREGFWVLDEGNHVHSQRLPAEDYLRLIGVRA